jgi:hypothetical protein
MGPADRPLRGHRGPILIFLGIRPNPKSLRDFLVHRFKRIDVLVCSYFRTEDLAPYQTNLTFTP